MRPHGGARRAEAACRRRRRAARGVSRRARPRAGRHASSSPPTCSPRSAIACVHDCRCRHGGRRSHARPPRRRARARATRIDELESSTTWRADRAGAQRRPSRQGAARAHARARWRGVRRLPQLAALALIDPAQRGTARRSPRVSRPKVAARGALQAAARADVRARGARSRRSRSRPATRRACRSSSPSTASRC